MVRRRRGRPLSCVFVADVGSWAVLSAMRAAVTVMWAVRTAAWAAGWCFGDGLTFPSPTMAGTRPAGTVPPVLRSRGRRRIWRAACRRRWASWRAVSEFSSPAPGGRLGRPAARGRTRNLGPRMGLYTAARKKVTKNVRSPNERRRGTAPVSTINCCLLSSSVAVGMVVVANVAVLLIRARGRRAGRRAAASVVGLFLPAAAAGNGVDGFFIVRIDGGDGVATGRGARSR